MEIRTHREIDRLLCGNPLKVEAGMSQVKLVTTSEMAADVKGLVHGGFIFGSADYAAMLAVNDPNVVLGAATVKFLEPVRVGDTLIMDAQVEEVSGRKHHVGVIAKKDETTVFKGTFTCFVLENPATS
ncbi:MaoC family dehydratase N-terminal domain-containing protein [Desulfosarcina sp. OttesenSCG-928-A07]|nr:MaoC family dehydratase N-terminal domain-containing protein [Desulfosarcina sp. OttesenSCG-928-A07]